MILLFRLSNIIPPPNNVGASRLKGQAVLVIANTAEANMTNFLSFMNIEKIRLLLLIKEELLGYLQKLFDADAFIEAIKNRKQLLYQRQLRHGINDYLIAQDRLIADLAGRKDVVKTVKILKIVTNAIKGQINASIIQKDEKLLEVTPEMFYEKVKLIFETIHLPAWPIELSSLNVNFSFNELFVHPAMYDIIIPELIINMRKYSPLVGEKKLSIYYDNTSHSFVFINNVNPNISKEILIGRQGLKMCNNILRDLEKKPLQTEETGGKFIVQLTI